VTKIIKYRDVVCERSSQNGPWRFECSNFTSKNVMYVVHVLVKRKRTSPNAIYLVSNRIDFARRRSVSNQELSAPRPLTLTSKIQRHCTCLQKIWIIYKKKKFPETSKIRRNSGNPNKTEILVFRILKKSI